MSKNIEKNDRRANRRFPLDLELSYKVRGPGPALSGSGITYNIASRGVLFQADLRLERYDEVELTIHWPALLNDTARLNLVVWGRVIRNHAGRCAMEVWGHEFRTRASNQSGRAAASLEKVMPGLFAARQKIARCDETLRVA